MPSLNRSLKTYTTHKSLFLYSYSKTPQMTENHVSMRIWMPRSLQRAQLWEESHHKEADLSKSGGVTMLNSLQDLQFILVSDCRKPKGKTLLQFNQTLQQGLGLQEQAQKSGAATENLRPRGLSCQTYFCCFACFFRPRSLEWAAKSCRFLFSSAKLIHHPPFPQIHVLVTREHLKLRFYHLL